MSMSASASRAALIEAGRNRLSQFREEKKRSENPKLTDSALKRRVTWASDVGSTGGPLPAQPSFGTETVENEAPAFVPSFKARTPTKASTTPTSAGKKKPQASVGAVTPRSAFEYALTGKLPAPREQAHETVITAAERAAPTTNVFVAAQSTPFAIGGVENTNSTAALFGFGSKPSSASSSKGSAAALRERFGSSSSAASSAASSPASGAAAVSRTPFGAIKPASAISNGGNSQQQPGALRDFFGAPAAAASAPVPATQPAAAALPSGADLFGLGLLFPNGVGAGGRTPGSHHHQFHHDHDQAYAYAYPPAVSSAVSPATPMPQQQPSSTGAPTAAGAAILAEAVEKGARTPLTALLVKRTPPQQPQQPPQQPQVTQYQENQEAASIAVVASSKPFTFSPNTKLTSRGDVALSNLAAPTPIAASAEAELPAATAPVLATTGMANSNGHGHGMMFFSGDDEIGLLLSPLTPGSAVSSSSSSGPGSASGPVPPSSSASASAAPALAATGHVGPDVSGINVPTSASSSSSSVNFPSNETLMGFFGSAASAMQEGEEGEERRPEEGASASSGLQPLRLQPFLQDSMGRAGEPSLPPAAAQQPSDVAAAEAPASGSATMDHSGYFSGENSGLRIINGEASRGSSSGLADFSFGLGRLSIGGLLTSDPGGSADVLALGLSPDNLPALPSPPSTVMGPSRYHHASAAGSASSSSASPFSFSTASVTQVAAPAVIARLASPPPLPAVFAAPIPNPMPRPFVAAPAVEQPRFEEPAAPEPVPVPVSVMDQQPASPDFDTAPMPRGQQLKFDDAALASPPLTFTAAPVASEAAVAVASAPASSSMVSDAVSASALAAAEAEVFASKAEAERLASEASLLSAQVESLHRTLKQRSQEATSYRQQLDRAHLDLQASLQDLVLINEDKRSLEAQLKSAEESLKAKEAVVATLQAQLEQQQREAAAIAAAPKPAGTFVAPVFAYNEHQHQQMKGQIALLQAETASLRAERDSLRRKNDDLEERLRAQADATATARLAAEEAQRKQHFLEGRLEGLTSELEGLRASLYEAMTAEAESSASTNDAADKFYVADAVLAQQRKEMQQASSSSSSGGLLALTAPQTPGPSEGARLALMDVQTPAPNTIRKTARFAAEQRDLIMRLRSKAEDLEDRLMTAEAIKETAQQQVERLSSRVAELRAANDKLREASDAMEKERSQAVAATYALRDKVTRLEGEVDASKGETRALQARIGDLQAELAKQERAAQEASMHHSEESGSLRRARDEALRAAAVLKLQLEDAETRLKVAAENRASLQAMLDETLASASAYRNASEKSSQLAAEQQEREVASIRAANDQQLAALQQRVAEADKALEAAVAERDALKPQMASLEQRIESLQAASVSIEQSHDSDMRRLKAEIESLGRERSTLASALAQMMQAQQHSSNENNNSTSPRSNAAAANSAAAVAAISALIRLQEPPVITEHKSTQTESVFVAVDAAVSVAVEAESSTAPATADADGIASQTEALPTGESVSAAATSAAASTPDGSVAATASAMTAEPPVAILTPTKKNGSSVIRGRDSAPRPPSGSQAAARRNSDSSSSSSSSSLLRAAATQQAAITSASSSSVSAPRRAHSATAPTSDAISGGSRPRVLRKMLVHPAGDIEFVYGSKDNTPVKAAKKHVEALATEEQAIEAVPVPDAAASAVEQASAATTDGASGPIVLFPAASGASSSAGAGRSRSTPPRPNYAALAASAAASRKSQTAATAAPAASAAEANRPTTTQAPASASAFGPVVALPFFCPPSLSGASAAPAKARVAPPSPGQALLQKMRKAPASPQPKAAAKVAVPKLAIPSAPQEEPVSAQDNRSVSATRSTRIPMAPLEDDRLPAPLYQLVSSAPAVVAAKPLQAPKREEEHCDQEAAEEADLSTAIVPVSPRQQAVSGKRSVVSPRTRTSNYLASAFPTSSKAVVVASKPPLPSAATSKAAASRKAPIVTSFAAPAPAPAPVAAPAAPALVANPSSAIVAADASAIVSDDPASLTRLLRDLRSQIAPAAASSDAHAKESAPAVMALLAAAESMLAAASTTTTNARAVSVPRAVAPVSAPMPAPSAFHAAPAYYASHGGHGYLQQQAMQPQPTPAFYQFAAPAMATAAAPLAVPSSASGPIGKPPRARSGLRGGVMPSATVQQVQHMHMETATPQPQPRRAAVAAHVARDVNVSGISGASNTSGAEWATLVLASAETSERARARLAAANASYSDAADAGAWVTLPQAAVDNSWL